MKKRFLALLATVLIAFGAFAPMVVYGEEVCGDACTCTEDAVIVPFYILPPMETMPKE